MSLLIFSTSFLTRSLLWKNLTNDLSYFHDLSFRISHKFAFCEKFACENSHYAKARILRKFACEKSHFAKIRTRKIAFCENSHFAKIRMRKIARCENSQNFASFRKMISKIFRIRIASQNLFKKFSHSHRFAFSYSMRRHIPGLANNSNYVAIDAL